MAETCKITADQSQRACKLLIDMKNNMDAVTELIKNLTQEVTDKKYDTKMGISLLDLKNNTFLSYISNLMYTTQLKLSGHSLVRHPVIDRLIEQRVVIEKLSPYESKLKHQIEKYLKGDTDGPSGSSAAEDSKTTGLKASDFAVGDDDEEQDDDYDDGLRPSSVAAAAQLQIDEGKYRVPKVSQNKFSDQAADEEKNTAARRRLLNSAMMQDALYEHSTDPDVIQHSNALQRRAQKKRDEIKTYEEDNLTRIQVSKKDRMLMKASNTAGQMHGELLGFSDVGLLTGEGGDFTSKKRKRSSGGGKKTKSKKGKRRH